MRPRLPNDERMRVLRTSLTISEACRRLTRMGQPISPSGMNNWLERRGLAPGDVLLRRPGEGGDPDDAMSRAGAERLAMTIKRYWRERGYEVAVSVESAGWMKEIRAERVDVRSELVNGLPPRSER